MQAQANPSELAHPAVTNGSALSVEGAELPDDGKAWDIPILMYHSIDDAGPPELAPYRTSTAAFYAQMNFLAAQGYRSISLTERADAVASRRRIPGRPIVITFDDGYRNFLHHAWPILKQAGLTATLFVVTDKVGQTADWDAVTGNALPLMNWDELRELHAQGCEIGSHTASHRSLPDLSMEEVVGEGFRARDRLQSELGVDAKCVAFPWGRSNEQVRAALVRAGYSVAVTTCGGISTLIHDPFNLPRIEILPQDNLGAFAAKLSTSETPNARSASVTTLPRAAPRISDVVPIIEGNGLPIHPDYAKRLAARLEALMGAFASFQNELLIAGGLGATLQARISRIFREPLTGAVTRWLAPFEMLSSGVTIGFEAEAQARLTVEPKSRLAVSPEDCTNTVRVDVKGSTSYLSLEFRCTWPDISAAQRFQLGIYGTVSRSVVGRAFVRLTATGGSCQDVVLASFELGSEQRNFNRSGEVPFVDYVNVDTSKPPTLIFQVDLSQMSDFTLKLNYLSLYFD